uniref:Uncharacterized protein n=1 Tax=mine drainage metagenome TaxID=410659 RepID=E6PT87_9ZZZZ
MCGGVLSASGQATASMVEACACWNVRHGRRLRTVAQTNFFHLTHDHPTSPALVSHALHPAWLRASQDLDAIAHHHGHGISHHDERRRHPGLEGRPNFCAVHAHRHCLGHPPGFSKQRQL